MNEIANLLCEPMAMDSRWIPKLLSEIKVGTIIERKPIEVNFYSEHGQHAKDSVAVPSGNLVAVVPLSGVLTRHGMWTEGTAAIGRMLLRLEADAEIGAIVLYVDSPGGSVYGTGECADIVYGIRDRGTTHVVAAVDPLMASAATWIATAANEVVAIPSADVGSIGVISSYADYSKMYSEMGIDITVVRTPDGKARFTGYEPLTEEMQKVMVERSRLAYSSFLEAMARNRSVSVADVEEKFGAGEVMRSDQGVKAGLIDRVGTIDDVLNGLLSASRKQSSRRMAQVAKNRTALNSF